MPQTMNRVLQITADIFKQGDDTEFRERLRLVPPEERPLPERAPHPDEHGAEALQARQDFLRAQGHVLEHVAGRGEPLDPQSLKGNVECQIGWCQVPVGVIGPLRISGLNASGDFYVPLATSEGALVASYGRGARLISRAGGARAACISESVSRAPCFIFKDIVDAGVFLNWVLPRVPGFREIVSRETRHGELVDIKLTINGSTLFLTFDFTTGDAAGQNMVTAATNAICRSLVEQSPVKPSAWYLDGNLSGDKKASMLSFLGVRGKKVVAEAILPAADVRRALHCTPREMARYSHTSVLGGVQSGSIGVQGHFSNALTAIYLACGQDVACVSESAVGITDMQETEAGDLQVHVSLPNLIVGTVGGGTHLPTARECLRLMDCEGAGRARKLAEICAVTALAGEISIIGAMAAGEFGAAHQLHRHPQAESVRRG
ncbi:MAG: hydroxymethylglutaryl-CoA reductase [Candidatus Delongbacteria bacterium]